MSFCIWILKVNTELCNTDDSEFHNCGHRVGKRNLGDIFFGCKDH